MTDNKKIQDFNWLGKTVLIVEDITSNYNFLRVLLRKTGIDTIWVTNGKDALSEVKNNPSIDIILLDINLPLMNGYEAAAMIKEIRQNMPIIAQTAYALEGDMGKSLDAGCDDYISKPIEIFKLLNMMNKYL